MRPIEGNVIGEDCILQDQACILQREEKSIPETFVC
jgi:hypothetical protein